MMWKQFFFFLVCFALFLSTSFGQQENASRIGVVNLDDVMAESKAIQKVIKNVKEDIKRQQENITEQLSRYKSLSETYEKQKTILSEEQRQTREKELDELKAEIEDKRDRINLKIRKSEREMVDPTLKLVEKAIRKVGEEENYDIILRSDTVLYTSEKSDITPKVIRKIDQLESFSGTEDSETMQEVEESLSTPETEQKDSMNDLTF